ncbi:FAS-associated death domain protein [Sorex araneus]|uniref:FAS-associated death domain protein n=1 Tax=Sorex araneus TaxID=42254 RepID=UPI0024336EEF|nr:FAS-associated death domain protein [Sorex araneus]
MDPFLVLLHSLSAKLASEELTQLKFLCQDRVGKRKLERMQSGLDLFSVLLEQSALSRERTELLRHLLSSLRREDLLQLLDAFEAGAAAETAPEQRELHAAFDIVCTHVGRDWRRLARRLQVSDARINAIEERFPRNLPEQVREMLRVWKDARKGTATVAQLVAALRTCQMNLVADFVEAGTKQATDT